MDDKRIRRTTTRKEQEPMECPHCGRKTLITKLNGKPSPGQSCASCWKPFE